MAPTYHNLKSMLRELLANEAQSKSDPMLVRRHGDFGYRAGLAVDRASEHLANEVFALIESAGEKIAHQVRGEMRE